MGYHWNIKYPYVSDEIINLDWVIEDVKKMEQIIDDLADTIEELKAGLANLNTINARLDKLEAATADLNDMRKAIKALSDEDLNLQTQIDAIKQFIDSYDDALKNIKAYIDSKIAVVNKRIDTIAFEILDDVNTKIIKITKELQALVSRVDEIDTSVLNPWHFGLGRIDQDKNINFIYNDLADECLTAEQYCRLGLTASDYEAFDLTARDYWEFGKTKLHFRWVYMPCEGIRQEVSNVLTSIVNNIMGTFSATNYASLDLTADEYAALDLTAMQYLAYNTNGVALTSDNYSALSYLNSGLVIKVE